MLNVSNAFNEAFKSDLREVKMRVTINDVTYTDEDIISFNYNSSSIVGDTYAIGSTFANSIKLTLCKIVEGLKQLDVVKPEMGIVLPNGSTEFVKLGTFLISEEVNPDRNENRTSLECTDQMLMLDDNYESKLSYPAPINAVALEIANLAGVKVDKVSFGRLRQDKIEKPEGYTFRQAIGLIAQFEAGYVTFDREGLLAIKQLTDKNFEITPNEYFLKGLVKNELMFRPSGIQVKTGENEADVLSIGSKKGSVIKLENKLMGETLLKSVYEKIKGVNYYPYTLSWRGNPAIEAGDWLYITDLKGNKFKVPNLSYTLEYKGGLTAKSSVESVASNEVKFGYKSVLDQTIEYVNDALKNADGNVVSYGVDEPQNPKEGDVWFKKVGPDTQIWVYERVGDTDKFEWVLKVDTAGNTEAFEKTKDIEKDLENSKQEIIKIREQAEKGIQQADKNLEIVNENIKVIAVETKEEISKVQAEAKKAFQDSEKLINNIESKITDQENDVEIIKTKADKALQESKDLLNDVNGLKGTVSKQGIVIDKNTNDLKVKADKNDVDALRQTVSRQGTELGITKDAINLKADKTKLDNLENKFEQQAAEITVQSDEIKVQATKINNTNIQLADLKVKSDKISSSISETRNKVDGMRIGAANYIKYSDLKTKKSFNHFKTTSEAEFLEGIGVKFSGKEGSTSRHFLFTNELLGNDVQPGDSITFSVKFKILKQEDKTKWNTFFIRFFNKDNTFNDLLIDLKEKDFKLNKEYHESVTGVISEGFDKDKPIQISLGLFAGTELITKEWQLEKANIMSDWKPSFKDYATNDSVLEISSKIEQTNKSIVLKADKTEVDSIKKKVDKQNSDLTVAIDKIGLKADKSHVNALEETISKQSSELTVQSDKIQAQTNKIDSNTTQLSILKLQSDSLSSTITKTNDKLDNLKIGSANYIELSDLKSAVSFKHFKKNMDVELIEDVGAVCKPKNQNARTNLFTFEKLGNDFQVGDPVTFSIKFKITKWENKEKYNTFYARFFRKDGNFDDVLVDLRGKEYEIGKEYQESATYIIKNGFDFEKPVEISVALFAGIELITKEWQLEKATIMSDWKPSFKDVVKQSVFSTFVQTSDSFQQVIKNEMLGFTSNQTQLSNQITSTIEQISSSSDGLNAFTDWHIRNAKSEPKDAGMLRISVLLEKGNYYTVSTNVPMSNGFSNVFALIEPNDTSVTGINDINDKQSRTLLTKNDRLVIVVRNKEYQEAIIQGKYYIQIEKGKRTSPYRPAVIDTATKSQLVQLSNQISAVVSDNKENTSSISILQGAIQSTVKKDDVISSINQSSERITLDARKIHITGDTTIANAAISSAAIRDLSADKINTGTLDARKVRVVGIDAGNITTGTLNAIHIAARSITADKLSSDAIRVGLNDFGRNMRLSPNTLEFYDSNTLVGKLTSSGQEYWYGSRFIGHTGQGSKYNDSSVRGIVNQLNYEGDYISWSYKVNSYDSTYTSMFTLDPKGRFTGNVGIHMAQPLWVKELAVDAGRMRIMTIGTPRGRLPGIVSSTTKSGIVFGDDELFMLHKDRVMSFEKINNFLSELGSGTFYITTEMASNGTSNKWRTIRL